MPKNVKAKVQKNTKKTNVKKTAITQSTAKKTPVKQGAPKKAAVKKSPQPLAKKAATKVVHQKNTTKIVPKQAVSVKSAPQIRPVAKTTAAVKAPVVNVKASYKVGSYVVYPTHGVGRIMAEETQMIGEHELRMLVISFEKDKMVLRVPVTRAAAAGLRLVSTSEQMKKVFVTLKSKARTSRGMWSRRAQEYEAKINSGDVNLVAEVVRDLHQNVDQSERSYSERMIYESALARLVGELAAAEGTDHKTATDKLMKLLRAKVAAANAAQAALKEAA